MTSAQASRTDRSTRPTTTSGRTWSASPRSPRDSMLPARAGHDSLVPPNGLGEADAERRRGLEAELLLSPLDVQLAARLAVGLGAVPIDLALISGELHDELGEVLDRDLLGAADVDRVGFVVPLGGEHDG